MGHLSGEMQIDGKRYRAAYSSETGYLELEEIPSTGGSSGGGKSSSKPSGRIDKRSAPAEPGHSPGRTGEAEHADDETSQQAQEMKSLKIAVQRVLQYNRANKMQHNQLKGKLTLKSRALSKSQAGSKSIHSKKLKDQAMGYNIILLVDNSGSMAGGKINLANAIAKGLHTTFRDTDGINVKVLSFTDSMSTRADWGAAKCDDMSAGGGNADAAACYIAMTRHFQGAPNENYRNILLVLSDGEPCSGTMGEKLPKLDVWNCDNDEEDKATIAQFLNKTARANDIYIAGLGIMHNSSQIPNSRQVDNLKDVQKALITVLKGAVEA